jgi:hypothetical protein
MDEEEKNLPEHETLMTRLIAPGFSLGFEGHVEVVVADEFVIVAFFYAGNPEPQSPVTIPRALFKGGDEQVAQWAAAVNASFQNEWAKQMRFETERHFLNIANFVLHDMKVTSASLEDIIAAQVKEQASVLRARFKLPVGRGHYSKWNKLELLMAVHAAAATIPAKSLSWDRLNAWLKEHYRDRAPKTGKSLSELCRRHGLTLREIKRVRKNQSENAITLQGNTGKV